MLAEGQQEGCGFYHKSRRGRDIRKRAEKMNSLCRFFFLKHILQLFSHILQTIFLKVTFDHKESRHICQLIISCQLYGENHFGLIKNVTGVTVIWALRFSRKQNQQFLFFKFPPQFTEVKQQGSYSIFRWVTT